MVFYDMMEFAMGFCKFNHLLRELLLLTKINLSKVVFSCEKNFLRSAGTIYYKIRNQANLKFARINPKQTCLQHHKNDKVMPLTLKTFRMPQFSQTIQKRATQVEVMLTDDLITEKQTTYKISPVLHVIVLTYDETLIRRSSNLIFIALNYSKITLIPSY